MQNEIAVYQMTRKDARKCADEIRAGILNIRQKLLELYNGEGWTALGYDNWRECVQAEFSMSKSHAYELLNAAKTELNISAIAEKDIIPESQLRPLASLEPEQQREAWAKAQETAPDGKITAAHVQSVVDEYKKSEEVIMKFNKARGEVNRLIIDEDITKQEWEELGRDLGKLHELTIKEDYKRSKI